MTRRQNLTASYVLSGGLAFWGLSAPIGTAEVIDLGAGDSDLRVQSGVLDFGKEVPRRNSAQETDPALDGEGEAEIWLASASATRSPRSPRGTAEIEALVLDVGEDYLRHPGLKAAGLSGTEWLALFRSNIAVESAFNPEAESHVGAIGLGQLMPDTADALGVDPHDPEDNLRGSARYLLAQLESFGSAELALAAYNAGPEAVRKYDGIPPYAETVAHVAKVLRLTTSTLIPE
jgi:soluble lytic murein transglycosylase-like protein